MNTNNQHNTFDDDRSLPADLQAVAKLLDKAGQADAETCDDELEHRVFGASLGAFLGVEGVDAIVADMALQDQRAAGESVEDRVFSISVGELRSTPVASNTEHSGEARSVRHGGGPRMNTRRSWVRGLATAACLGLVFAGAMWLYLSGSAGTSPNATLAVNDRGAIKRASEMSDEELKAAVAADFNGLVSVVDELGIAETSTSESGFQAEWLDELVEEGQSS